MAAAEDRVLQYLAENPGASLVDISNAIVAFGADLNTVADMVGVPRAEAQAAFAPTIDTAAQEAEAQRQAQIAAQQAEAEAEAERQAEAEAQRQAQIAAQQAEAEAEAQRQAQIAAQQAEAEAQRQAQIAAQQAEAQRISDLYGNVSGAGGFDQSEVAFVTQLINSKQVDVGQVARDFGLPTDVVQSVYDTETQRQVEIAEKAEIERLTQNQAALESLSPAATTTISSPSLPDATYIIPGFSLPDYRYNDTSSSSGSSSGGAGGSSLGNYVLPTQNVSYGDMEMTITGTRGGQTGTTLERPFAPFPDPDSSLFHQDLKYQDDEEARRDVDYLNHLAWWQAHEDKTRLLANAASAEGGFDEGEIAAVTALLNSNAVTVEDVSRQFDVPIGVVQAAFDANKPPSEGTFDLVEAWLAPTDTKNEFLEDIAAAIKNEGIVTENLQATTADKAGALDPNFTASQAAIASGVGDLTTAKQNTKDVIDAALASGVVDQGDIDDAFGPTLVDTVLGGVGDVLGAGTGAIANVAGNIPVVGGALQDTVEGVADWLKNTKGTATVNPITGQVTGTWGEIPPWMEKQTVTQIGNIPGSKTTAGITTGTIADDIISIGRGEQDIEDVLKNRTEQVASTLGIDPKILAAAAAAGMSVKDYLESQKPKQTTLDTTTEGETEKETTATIDLSSGPDSDVLNEVLGPQQGVDTLTEAEEKEKNLAIATQVFEDAGGGAEGVQAVLDTLKENDLTVADLADLTGLNETDINTFIDTTLGDGVRCYS
jgi:hypothetical protein